MDKLITLHYMYIYILDAILYCGLQAMDYKFKIL